MAAPQARVHTTGRPAEVASWATTPQGDAARQHQAAGTGEHAGQLGRLHEAEHLDPVDSLEQPGHRADAGDP